MLQCDFDVDLKLILISISNHFQNDFTQHCTFELEKIRLENEAKAEAARAETEAAKETERMRIQAGPAEKADKLKSGLEKT